MSTLKPRKKFIVPSVRNKFNVLFMASSKGVGLTFNFSRLAVWLRKLGHKVIVVSEPKEEEAGLFKELMRNQIESYKLNGLANFSIQNTISAARAMEKIISFHDVNVIHAQGIRQLIVAFVASKIFCHKRRMRVVVTLHTTSHGTPYDKVTLLIESLLLNVCADFVISVARSVRRKLIDFGLFPSKVATVHNGIDLELFDEITHGNGYPSFLPNHFKSSSCIVVGYFASMIQRKGHKYLIQALPKVSERFPEVRLILTSSGPLRNQLENLSKNLGIDNKVLFTGKIRYQFLYQLLNNVDVYAFPSLAELFPFAILEAMAAGKPIVATDVGGVSEAVSDGVNGRLVPPGDPESLAKAMVELLSDPNKAREMGENSRALAEEKFHLAKIAYELTRWYEHSFEIVNI